MIDFQDMTSWPQITNWSPQKIDKLTTNDHFFVTVLGYFLVRMSYQLLVTIATVETVKHIPEDAYGLIYGLNTFFGLGLQCILTAVVNNTLNLSPQVQFQVYGAFYLIVCYFYLPILVLQIVNKCRRLRDRQENVAEI